MKPKFTIALIARNESKTLPRLVGSLKKFQDRGGEIILLDTGSTDNTAQIARDLGINVREVGEKFLLEIDADTANKINQKFCHEFGSVDGEGPVVAAGDKMFDFASARNYIAGFAENDMIAMPDCDEIYTKLDLDKIDEMISAGTDQFEYNFVFSHDDQGGELIKFRHSKFYNRRKLKWVGVIHEILQPVDDQTVAKMDFVEENVIKLEHWQNPETNRKGYLKGLAWDCYHNPQNDRNSHYFAREMFYYGMYRSAIKEFERHIAMDRWPAERSESMCYVGRALLQIGDIEEAVTWFTKAFHIEPRRREPLMHLAEHYYKMQQYDHALAFAAAATQVPDGAGFYANYQPYYENVPHEILYWAYWRRGDYRSSKYHFDNAIAYQPFNSKYLHDLRYYVDLPKISIVIPTLGRPDGLKRVVDSIQNLNYPQEKIQVVILHGGEKADAQWETDLNLKLGEDRFKVLTRDERGSVPLALKKGVEESDGAWIIYASNDIEFTPDSIISALKTANDNAKGFMAFNTGPVGPDEGNVCEHFMINRSLIPKLGGEIFDTEFHHVGVDNLLWAKLKRLGQAMRCDRAVVHHYHFSRTGEAMDDTYRVAWDEESVRQDRELLQKKLAELNNPIINNGEALQEHHGREE